MTLNSIVMKYVKSNVANASISMFIIIKVNCCNLKKSICNIKEKKKCSCGHQASQSSSSQSTAGGVLSCGHLITGL